MTTSAIKLVRDNFTIRRGRLVVQGIDIEAIARELGSPFYLYDGSIMAKRYRALKKALPAGAAIHYSLKANPNQAVARLFRSCGAGAEVASGQELIVARDAGFSPERIIFAGPGKSDHDLALALSHKIGCINIESATELDRIARLLPKNAPAGKPQKIAIRLNLDTGLAGKAEMTMTGGASKFGVDPDGVEPIVDQIEKSPGLAFNGFHCFAGTQIVKTAPLVNGWKVFAAWAIQYAKRTGRAIPTLNFGGGLGIPYDDRTSELDINAAGRALAAIKKKLGDSPLFARTRILLEPGRYLAGPAGVYVSRIIDIKHSAGQTFVITDGGIHHALLPIVMNKNYPTHIVTKLDQPRRVTCQVVGPLCSSADQLSRLIKIPQPEIGDLVGIFNSGAYGYTAGMLFFLSHPTPAEGLVEKGELFLVREPIRPGAGLRRKLTPRPLSHG